MVRKFGILQRYLSPRLYCWLYGHEWEDYDMFTGFSSDGVPLIEYYSKCTNCGKEYLG